MTYSKKNKDFYWLTDDTRTFLKRGYLLEGVSAEQRIKEISETAEKILNKEGFAEKFYNYMSKGWYSLSSPVWSNFGLNRGLGISCYSSYVGDSVRDIMYTASEVGIMSKYGGGTSAYFGNVRPRGSEIKNNGKSNGSFPFLKLFETTIDTISQGSCYVEGTQVLTNNGFKDFREVNKQTDKIAQVDDLGNVSFTNTYDLTVSDYNGIINTYEGKKKKEGFNLMVTPNHRMFIEQRRGGKKKRKWSEKLEMVKSEDLSLHRDNRIWIAGSSNNNNNELSMFERLLIAYQADGKKEKGNRKMRFRFTKKRKIERLKWILNNLNVEYFEHTGGKDNVTEISFYHNDIRGNESLEWVNLEKINNNWVTDFVMELSHWDGSITNNSVTYSTVVEKNIDVLQAMCAIGGKKIYKKVVYRENKQPLYKVIISDRVTYRGGESIVKKNEEYNGKVYCAIVPEGKLIVKSNECISICGNTRRGHFAAYIDIEHEDIEEWLNIQLEGNPIQLIYYGVCVGDEWLKDMIAGDKQKRKIWAKVLQNRAEIGVPYIFFKDNVNNNKPEVYKDKNMRVNGSNLCVAGNQKVRSQFGDKTVEELYEKGEELILFDGFKIVNASKMKKTGENKQTYTVHLDNGFTHTVTANHKISTTRGLIPYEDLRIDDEVYVVDFLPDKKLYNSKNIGQFVPFMPEKAKVVKFEKDQVQDVYCVTVDSKEHVWVCNGVITSNCSEITLSTDNDTSFVCCLSSMNLLHYEEWKDTDAVETLTYFLDAVMEEFIQKTENIEFFERANKFAKEQRALGLGVLGWHDYLMNNMIAFDSFEAMQKNNEIFKHIKEKSLAASEKMAKEYGEPELLKGYGRRNTTLMAIAPTKSSSFILGQVSQSIEPRTSNYYVDDKAKIEVTYKNPYLKNILKEKGIDTPETWRSILEADGSVQHLDILSEKEKNVFKTFSEISQLSVIQQAAQRQKYIDQSQSLNLMIHPNTPTKEINKLYLTAWELGVKTLYYQHSINAAQEYSRNLLTCSSCEG